MKSKQRIPFGQEQSLEIIATTCPGCNVSRGNYHAYGCPIERCPECGQQLLTCRCMALPVVDEFKLCAAIEKTLTKDQVLRMVDKSKLLDQTYEEKGAFSWIIENAPSQLKKEMEAMALEILGGEKHGDHFLMPSHKAAEAMGMSEEEAAPIMRELEAECLYPGWEQRTGAES